MNRSPGNWQWDDVRFFLAAARTRSLSRDGRVLGVVTRCFDGRADLKQGNRR
jgi:hypothetical protein